MGLSPRTNVAGLESLKEILEPIGYQITPVELKNCLHLKSACTAIDDDTFLVNPQWFDLELITNFRFICIPDEEQWAANVLRIHDTICMHSGFIKTIQLIENLGFGVKTIDISELLKAEAGMTCSSIIFNHPIQAE